MPNSGRELFRTLAPGAVLLAIFACPVTLPAAEPAIEFNRDIRPILSENCFACHGPDARKREAGLRLDRPDGAVLKLESGAVAIVAGKPAESELVRGSSRPTTKCGCRRPTRTSSSTPSRSGCSSSGLPAEPSIKGHWSYLPIRQQVPGVAGEPRSSNPIDGFILAELGRHGLAPRRRPIRLRSPGGWRSM